MEIFQKSMLDLGSKLWQFLGLGARMCECFSNELLKNTFEINVFMQII